MGYLGVSLIVASVVFVVLRPPQSLLAFLLSWRQPRAIAKAPDSSEVDTKEGGPSIQVQEAGDHKEDKPNIHLPGDEMGNASSVQAQREAEESSRGKEAIDRAAMPPPPILRKDAKETKGKSDRDAMPPPRLTPVPNNTKPMIHMDSEEQTTPRATPTLPNDSVPPLSLENPSPSTRTIDPTSSSPKPPRQPRPSRIPTLASFPAANSAQRALPNRTPAAGSSLLAPPPTHSTKPAKPSRKVVLTPGHSPLDWARISGPNSDLRNLPASTPYLRVTPSMLRCQTGRKGKDAWTALNGRVYNITPYLPYHPGGEPEMLRCAGRDGTALFGEIHPWVNYETMLAACLIGLLVEEDHAHRVSEMDMMD